MLIGAFGIAMFLLGIILGWRLQRDDLLKAREHIGRQRKLIAELTERLPGESTIVLRSWVND